jgi:hippurate hydrolase
MAANGIFEIELTGRDGHASQPELCRDPVITAAALTLNLQQIVARRLAPQCAAMVSVTSIDAPNGITVIPQPARLAGSIRVGDTAVRAEAGLPVKDIAADTGPEHRPVA